MTDFRQPTPDYIAEHVREQQLADEQAYYSAYRRPTSWHVGHAAVEAEGSAINNRRIATD